MKKLCANVSVVLSGNNIDFVHETKSLGVIINSSMKTSSDVVRQTRKFYAQANRSVSHISQQALPCTPPPPKNDRGWVHFFRKGV